VKPLDPNQIGGVRKCSAAPLALVLRHSLVPAVASVVSAVPTVSSVVVGVAIIAPIVASIVVGDGVSDDTSGGHAGDGEGGIDALHGASVGIISRGTAGGEGREGKEGSQPEEESFLVLHAPWTGFRMGLFSAFSGVCGISQLIHGADGARDGAEGGGDHPADDGDGKEEEIAGAQAGGEAAV
jgi:hypothetical protein